MARRKVKLAFIVNDTARRSSYKKRTKGLLKKIYELSTLCGIDACAVVYGPYEPEPEIWPSPEGVQTVISKFRETHEFVKSKKMVNQETFMKERVLKAKEKLKKHRQDNWETEMEILLSQCLAAGKIVHSNMSMVDSKHLGWLIDQNLKEVDRRLEAMGSNDHSQSQMMTSQIPLQLAPPPAPMDDEVVMMGHGHAGMPMNNSNDHSQSEMMTTQRQIPLQLAPPPAPMDDEMVMMGHGQAGMTMNNSGIIQSPFFMDFKINGNGDEAIPFGEVNPEFLPNLLP